MCDYVYRYCGAGGTLCRGTLHQHLVPKITYAPQLVTKQLLL